MSPPGRPKGEFQSAQHEGAPVNALLGAELQAIAGFAQVNLLETMAAERNRSLPWWSPLACMALVLSIALGSGLQLNPLVTEQKTRALKREAQVQEQARLIELAARQNKGVSAKDQALALQAALTQQERLLALLGGDSRGNGAGQGDSAATAQDFSALLEGLSRTRVDGLWLTQVRLDRRTQEVRLEGQARHAQLVSGYIDDLSRNPRFKGLVLAAVEVSRPAASGGAAAVGAVSGGDAAPARFKLASAQGAAANKPGVAP
jgi:Fimbrial assembly protein (PilN)